MSVQGEGVEATDVKELVNESETSYRDTDSLALCSDALEDGMSRSHVL